MKRPVVEFKSNDKMVETRFNLKIQPSLDRLSILGIPSCYVSGSGSEPRNNFNDVQLAEQLGMLLVGGSDSEQKVQMELILRPNASKKGNRLEGALSKPFRINKKMVAGVRNLPIAPTISFQISIIASGARPE